MAEMEDRPACAPACALRAGKSPHADRWLSMKEICKHLGVSDDTVYKWINRYDMPAHRLGRLWKFKKAEVDAWVKSGGATEAKDKGEK